MINTMSLISCSEFLFVQTASVSQLPFYKTLCYKMIFLSLVLNVEYHMLTEW